MNSTPRNCSEVPEAKIELVELRDRKHACCPEITGGVFFGRNWTLFIGSTTGVTAKPALTQ